MTGDQGPLGAAHRRRGLLGAAAAVLAVAGVALITVALLLPASTPAPPQPPAVTAGAPGTEIAAPRSVSPAVPPAAASTGPVLARSLPVSLDVPSIGVHSMLLQLGVNSDRTVQVPPLEKDSKAGWFTYSPTPGELGPAVLLGHVDTAQWGPGVFYRLGVLKPGQTVDVTRADRAVAEFVVDRVESYPKDTFPSLQVYGNTPDAQLRLITCGGVFDTATRNYENNIVVYAHLTATRPA